LMIRRIYGLGRGRGALGAKSARWREFASLTLTTALTTDSALSARRRSPTTGGPTPRASLARPIRRWRGRRPGRSLRAILELATRLAGAVGRDAVILGSTWRRPLRARLDTR
jgi:hypothetical protein